MGTKIPIPAPKRKIGQKFNQLQSEPPPAPPKKKMTAFQTMLFIINGLNDKK